MSEIKVITDNQPREIIDGWRLSAAEREEFDYLDWPAIDDGRDSASFFRYQGDLHDLGEFTRDYGITKGAGLPPHLSEWDGYRSDSFFSALVVRLTDADGQTRNTDLDHVIVGLVLS